MPKKRHSPNLKATLATRAGYLCEYCKSPKAYIPIPFDIEHIVPISLGGVNEMSNFAYSCHGCNLFKSNKTEAIDLVNNSTVSLFHPRKNQWDKHFVWDETEVLIQGITPIGRATIDALKLNREAVVNLRELLILVGKHPPK